MFVDIFLKFSYTPEHPDDSNQKLFPLDLFHSNMDFYSRFLELKLKFLEPVFACLPGWRTWESTISNCCSMWERIKEIVDEIIIVN